MKKQLFKILLILFLSFGIMTACSIFFIEKFMVKTEAENELVLLNEIEQLTTDSEGQNPAQEEIAILKGQLQTDTVTEQKAALRQFSFYYLLFSFLLLISGVGYIYYKILRPFYKLEKYADRVAKGDFDFSLNYERTNFFGAFTWAFDHMRKEIILARQNEAKAVEENKTIIATLSHDIKTPIASIRAYAEGLEACLDSDYEQRERYLQVIMKKCDQVSRLVDDLVLHSLSELERLEMREDKVNVRRVLVSTLQDLEYPYVSMREPIPEAELWIDEKRLSQVLLNLLENARKYAPDTRIEVWAVLAEKQYEIHVRDHGKGILPEDMPFVFQKFYRGKNVGDKSGSGLGLYIVKYIMNRMKGDVVLHNHEDGLEAVIWLPLYIAQSS